MWVLPGHPRSASGHQCRLPVPPEASPKFAISCSGWRQGAGLRSPLCLTRAASTYRERNAGTKPPPPGRNRPGGHQAPLSQRSAPCGSSCAFNPRALLLRSLKVPAPSEHFRGGCGVKRRF